MPIRLLLVDDHAILRAGVRMLLQQQPDITVVADVGSGAEALTIVEELRPDVVILDISLPDKSGVNVARELVRRHPDGKVLVLTMHEEVNYLQQLFEAGAWGYLLKSAADAELVTAIRTVYEGKKYVDPSLAGELASQLWSPPGRPEPNAEVLLSQREREVLAYIAQGYTNKETAARLHVSVKTVESYRMRLMRKLGLKTRADLVRYAARIGLLTAL